MNKIAILFASTSLLVSVSANAAIPVTEDGPLLATTIKDSVVLAKQLALEIKGWVDVANTYATAVQNTVALPAAAIAQVNSLYGRAKGLATAASTITGPNSSMMQRFQTLQNVGKSGGGLPGDVAYNFEYWNKMREAQMTDDAKLLGLEEERRKIEEGLLGLGQINSATATGQMQALQAQGQITAAVGSQVQHTNQLLQQGQSDQQMKDEMVAAQQRAYQAAREADLQELEHMSMTPKTFNQTPILWGR